MEQTRDTNSQCTLCQYLNESPSTKELLDSLQDPIQLSRRLRELSPSKRSACIVGLILRATKIANNVGLLTSLPESQVLDMMEEVRELLEGASSCILCTTDPEGRTHLLRRLLIKLSKNTQTIPRSFLIRGIELQGSHPAKVGGFADVFQASYQGQLVALKRLRYALNKPISESEENEFRREAFISWFLSHPNIQPFLGIDQTTFYPLLCIVSTWQHNGNILDWLKYFTALGLPILADECIKRILSGVCYLHKNGITHGDLSSKNVLIDGHFNPRLADFGLSTLHGAGSSTMGSHSSGGTLRFMAPEVLEGSAQSSFAVDMYAFACVCIELYTLQPPFPTLNDFQVMFAVMQGSRPSKPSEPTNSLDGFWEVVSQCWNSDPRTRPSADSLALSLPLQKPALMPDSSPLSHVNWEIPGSEPPPSPASDSPFAGHHLHRDPTCTLDSCLVGLLDFSTPHGKNVHEMLERLAALGCPEKVTRFVREGLADNEAADTVPHLQVEVSVATPEGEQIATYPMITTGVDPGESAPVQGTVERTAERATSLFDLGCRLSDLGKYKGASECFLQAVEIQRELSTAKPDELRPLLASSLHWAAYCLDTLGEFKGSVKYALEAIDLRQELARENPDEFNAPLAHSLHDLAFYLSHLGEWKDAVVHVRQAVDIRQDLARENPNQFNAYLADSLHQLAFSFSHLGEWKDAMVCVRQAVDIRQDLTQENPDEFNALLANSLHDLAFYLSHLGEWKDAVVCVRQAVDIRQDLARENPNQFNAHLADSLYQLAFYLSTLREWKDAVVYSRRAVGIYQDLARVDFDKFGATLALCLTHLATYSGKLGQHEDVVKFGREAVAHFRTSLAHDHPEWVQERLISVLDLLGPSLVILGLVDEAVQVDQEAKRLKLESLRGVS